MTARASPAAESAIALSSRMRGAVAAIKTMIARELIVETIHILPRLVVLVHSAMNSCKKGMLKYAGTAKTSAINRIGIDSPVIGVGVAAKPSTFS